MTDLSSWTKARCTAGAPQTDPTSGRSYVRVTCDSSTNTHFLISPASGAVNANGSFSIELRPGSGTGWIGIQASSAPDNQILWINVGAKESYLQKCAGGITATYTDGFYLVEGHCLNGGVVGNLVLYLNAVNTAGVLSATSTTDGTQYIDIANPTIIDSTIALDDEFQFGAISETTTAEGILRFKTTTPYTDSVSNMIATPGRLDILLPDTYDPGNEYPLVICLGVEGNPGAAYPAEMPIIATADLHNTRDAIVCQWSNQNALFPWWGAKDTGTNDYEKVIANQLIPYMRERYSITAGRDGIGLFGWSKGGWGALSLILRNPTKIGFAAVWDADYNETFDSDGGPNDYEEDVFFGTEAQFELYNPKTLLPSHLASINDKKRLYVSGAVRFVPDTLDLHSDLATNSIEHEWDYHDAAAAGGFAHTSSFGWIAGDGDWATIYGGESVFNGLVDMMTYVAPSPDPNPEPTPPTEFSLADFLISGANPRISSDDWNGALNTIVEGVNDALPVQYSAIPDATSFDVVTKVNAVLAVLRGNGMIES